MITLTTTLSGRELGESVLFQVVLKAYPTCSSWIITAHVSLGHLELEFLQWTTFRTHQLLQFLSQQPSAPTQLISTLQWNSPTLMTYTIPANQPLCLQST